MKTQIEPSTNRVSNRVTKTSWPRHLVTSVECRERDLVIRIANWTRQSPETGEPAYDVEVYVGGVYDWNLSKVFTTAHGNRTKAEARKQAIAFAQGAIAAYLK